MPIELIFTELNVATPPLSVAAVLPDRQPEVTVQPATEIVTSVLTGGGPHSVVSATVTGIAAPTVVLIGWVLKEVACPVATVVVELIEVCVSGGEKTCLKVSPEKDEPVHACASQVDTEHPEVAAGAFALKERTNDCSGFNGDMFEIEIVFGVVVVFQVTWPIQFVLGETLVSRVYAVGSVSLNELIDELPLGVSFLNVAVSDTLPALMKFGNIATLNFFSGAAALPGSANAVITIAIKKQSSLRMPFMKFP